MVIVRDLPKLTAKDELSAFKSLKEATKKFESFGIEERDVPRLVENFNEDPLKIQKRYPHLSGLAQAVYKYQTAHITYDLAVTKAARKYLPQTANSIFKNTLKNRVTLESTDWDKFCNFFGVKTEHRQMLEFSVSFKPPKNRPQKNVRFPKDGTPIGRVKPIPLTKKERFNRRGIIFERTRLRIRLKHLKSYNDPADRIWKVEIEKNLNSLWNLTLGIHYNSRMNIFPMEAKT